MTNTSEIELFRKAQSLFDQAIELPHDQQLPFLQSECQDDQRLLEECKNLLNNEHSHGSFMKQLYGNASSENNARSFAMINQTIGPYHIQEKLGRGGMADVYLAKRTDGVHEGEVALKVIQDWDDRDILIKRFSNERNILANLRHPNIAQLLDGGSTEEGLPYFVMEYVKGDKLDVYCNEHNLSVRQRLKLFLKVCAAVSYAHQNLIIHRDIKPNNILVDAHGEPKLLDFGLAKIVNKDRKQDTTVMGLALTPNYASPEQLRGDVLTTASDLYSLGVLLYELLSGCRPYEKSMRSPSEAESITAPSKMVLKKAEDTLNREEKTQLDNKRSFQAAKKISYALKGDLDTIVLKLLRKEPERRYTSVQALAEDIERHLTLQPVLASKDTLWYRSNRFIRRHAVILSVTCIALLTVFIGMSVQQVRVMKERDIAKRERDVAIQIQDFMTGLFEISDPEKSLGETVTARELLDNGAERIRNDLKQQPGVKSELISTIGYVYQQLGMYQKATPLLEEALQIRRDNFAKDSIEIAQSLAGLGRLYELQGKFEQAEKSHREALDIYINRLGNKHIETAFTYNGLGNVLAQTGRFQQAVEHFEKSLSIRSHILGENHQDVAKTHGNLGLTYREMDKRLLAIKHHTKSLEIILNTIGTNHPLAPINHNALAHLFEEVGQYDKAIEHFQEALLLTPKVLGKSHPLNGDIYDNMAVLYRKTKQLDSALEYNHSALNQHLSTFGEEHPKVVLNYRISGDIYNDKGLYTQAEEYAQKSIKLGLDVLGPEHSYVGDAYNTIGQTYNGKGEYDVAIHYFEKAMAIWNKIYADPHSATALSYHNLGISYRQKEQHALALEYFQKAYDIRLEKLEKGHPDLEESESAISETSKLMTN